MRKSKKLLRNQAKSINEVLVRDMFLSVLDSISITLDDGAPSVIGHDHDDRYYTKAESNLYFYNKTYIDSHFSPLVHSHIASDIIDFSEAVDDRISNLVQNGTGLTWSYNDTLNRFTPTVSLSPFSSDQLAEGTTHLYATTTEKSNWNTAYGWGNHASAGYLTSFSETDTLNSVLTRGNTSSLSAHFGNVSTFNEYRLKSAAYPTAYHSSFRSDGSANGILQFGNNGTNYILAGNSATGGTLVFKVNVIDETLSSGIEAMRLLSSGSAVFSYTVSAERFVASTINSNPVIDVTGNDPANAQVRINNIYGYSYALISGISGYSNAGFSIRSITGGVDILKFNPGHAATFYSYVTSAGFTSVTNWGLQFYAATGGSNWQLGSDGAVGSGMYLFNSIGGYAMTLSSTGTAVFAANVSATYFTASNRTILAAGGIYDNSTYGNDTGIGFGGGAIYSTNGAGTLTKKDLGSAGYTWGSVYGDDFFTRGLQISGVYSNSPYTSSSWIKAPAGTGVFFVNSTVSYYFGLKSDNTVATNVPMYTSNITLAGGSTLYFTSGDIQFLSNAGYGILSADSNRLVSIQNGLLTIYGAQNTTLGANLTLGIKQLALDNYSYEGVGITFNRTSSPDDLMALGVVESDKLGFFSRSGIIFATGGTTIYSATIGRMMITDDGNVIINSNGSNTGKFQLYGDAYIYKNGEYLASVAVNSSAPQYQTWYNSVGTRRAYFGFPSSGDNTLALVNETGGALSFYGASTFSSSITWYNGYGVLTYDTGMAIIAASSGTSLHLKTGAIEGISIAHSTGLVSLYHSSATSTPDDFLVRVGYEIKNVPIASMLSAIGAYAASNPAGYITSASLTDTLNTVAVRGNVTEQELKARRFYANHYFGTVSANLGYPSNSIISIGARFILEATIGYHSAIGNGINNSMWFQVGGSTTGGYQWYHGATGIAELSTLGGLILANTLYIGVIPPVSSTDNLLVQHGNYVKQISTTDLKEILNPASAVSYGEAYTAGGGSIELMTETLIGVRTAGYCQNFSSDGYGLRARLPGKIYQIVATISMESTTAGKATFFFMINGVTTLVQSLQTVEISATEGNVVTITCLAPLDNDDIVTIAATASHTITVVLTQANMNIHELCEYIIPL